MVTELQNRKKQNLAAFLQFTILFCILAVGIYGVLIINHKSFLRGGDGIKQSYFWTVELKHQMEMLFAGKGLQLWSWSKFLGMSVQTNKYWDPFNWLAAAFPAGYIELGFTISTLLRIYCGGAAFLALMRYTGLSVFSGVFGAAVYSFTGFTIWNGMAHAEFLANIYLFPLLILSVEMIYRDKSPAFFSLVTGLYIVTNFYYSYMAAISIIPYIILRYFAYREFRLKDFAKTIGRFAFFGTLGICVGGIQFVPDFASLYEASTSSATDSFSLLFDKDVYANIGNILVGTGSINEADPIGWTLILIILLAAAIAGFRLGKTPVLMTLLLFMGAMCPAVCSVYNGLGYPSRRWIFALELFAAWAAASELDDEESLLRRSGTVRAAAVLGLTAFLTLGMNKICDLGLSKEEITFIVIQLFGGALFVILLALVRKEGRYKKLSRAMILVILTATLSASWTVSFMECKPAFYRNNRINKLLGESTQRAGALIDDDSFYRIDQVDSVLYRHRVKLPANETLWWQTRSVYGYNSRIPSDLLEFNRMVGNNYGYARRVAVISNDNRTGLDYLCGVKYFLGDDLKNGATGSDEYAGYGFEEYQTLDGVRVFRSKYDVSLGYVFDKYMSESEFEKLGYAEREQALLQAAVLPDDRDIPSLSSVKADDIRTAVRDVKFTVAESDGAVLNDDNIVVDKVGGSVTLKAEDVENSQLLFSITGLLRNVSEGQSESFEMHVKNEFVEEIANNKRTNQTIPNIKDYNLNLGYYDHYSDGKIKISFSAPGVYRYDDLKLKAMDAGLFDDCIEELGDRRYKITSFSDEAFEGTVDSENGGILFLSILEPKRWECYIDGEKAEIINNTDKAFTGVEVPGGHHQISIRFRNKTAEKGIMLSIAGLVVLAAVCMVRRKVRKKI